MAVGAALRPGGRRAGWLARAVTAGALTLAPAPALGQAVVTSARLSADLGGAPGGAAVRMEYALSGVSAGDSVAVTLLDFGLPVSLEVRVGDADAVVRVPVALGAAHRARLPVEAAPGGGARLVVRYRVPLPAQAQAGSGVAHVPVLTVDAKTEPSRSGLFQAEVRVPSEWTVTEAFPTALARPGAGGTLRAGLPVVPSVVTLRFRQGSRGVSLPLLANVLAAACLALVGIAGWRQLSPRRP